jgi:hypothetical protein
MLELKGVRGSPTLLDRVLFRIRRVGKGGDLLSY